MTRASGECPCSTCGGIQEYSTCVKKHTHTSLPFAAHASRLRTHEVHGAKKECAGRGVRILHTSRSCWTSAITVCGSTTRPLKPLVYGWVRPPSSSLLPRAPPYPTRMRHRSSHCKAGWNMPLGSKVQLLRVTPHVVLTTDPRATCFCESESPSLTHTHRPPPLPCRPWLLVDSASELECNYINMLAGDKFGRRRRRRRRRRRVLTAPPLTVHGHAQSSMGRWCREFPALPAPPPTHRDQTPTRLRAPWRTACGW